VPELSHDTADDGFHEIQLSGKQLVFLFLVTTTIIVVVFLCGVKVGRGARAAQAETPDQMVAAGTPGTQPVPDTGPPASGPQAAGPPAAEPPAPAAETPDALSYHERLKGAAPREETLKPKAEARPEPAPEPAPKPTPPASAQASAPVAESAGVPTAGRPGTWAVQVIATRDRDMATSIVKRLAGRGYPAFLVVPPAGAGPAYYKVHVGRYTDRGEAEQVSLRIKKEEQFQSWITR
jgi:cell division septation protein DedD